MLTKQIELKEKIKKRRASRPLRRDFYKSFYRKDYLVRLNRQRIAMGFTHDDISIKTGYSRQYISQVFTGKNQSPNAVRDIAEAIGLFFTHLIH